MVMFATSKVNRFQCWLIKRGWMSPYVKRKLGNNITAIHNLSDQPAIVEWGKGGGAMMIAPNSVHYFQGPKRIFRVRPINELGRR